MRIVITGATGNLGTALLRRLTASDEHDLVGLARRLPDDSPFDGRVTWRSVDLTDDGATQTLTEAFAGADAVVHLAWGFQPSHDLAYLERLGVGGTRRVLEAGAGAGVPPPGHISSIGAFPPQEG